MADQATHSATIWERLRLNREKNSRFFTEAGIRPEALREVICPSCGAQENVLFWSDVRRKGKKVHLVCPICEAAQVYYSLANNAPVDPVFTRGTVGGGLGMLVFLGMLWGLFYFRETVAVQMLAAEVNSFRESVTEQKERRPGYSGGTSGRASAPPPSRGGSGGASRPASSGSAGSSARSGGSAPARTTPSRAPAAQASAPAPERRATPLWQDRAAEPDQGGLVFVARGDRREELDLYAAQIIERGRQEETRLLLQVQYDPESDMTRIVVDSASVEWPRRLGWLRGWRRG